MNYSFNSLHFHASNKESNLNKCIFILGHNSHKERKLRGDHTAAEDRFEWPGGPLVLVVLPPPVVLYKWTEKENTSLVKLNLHNSEGS